MSGFHINRWCRIGEHWGISQGFLRGKRVRYRENKRRRSKYRSDRVSRIGRTANSGLCFDKAGRKLSYRLSQRLSCWIDYGKLFIWVRWDLCKN